MNHPDTPRSQGRHAGGPTDLSSETGTEVPSVLEQASLEQVIGRLGPMPPQRTAVVGLAVLDQLVAVHNRGMLHGDVRPGSVLLGPYDQIILTGPTLPSPVFTAPEGVTSPAADLWSLGATLYTAVEGHPPSPGGALENAGPIAPILFSLLSGDPTQRPAPGFLRMALLDIAQSRGEASVPRAAMAASPPRFEESFPPPFSSQNSLPPGSSAFPPPFSSQSSLPPGSSAFPPPPRSFGSGASGPGPFGSDAAAPSDPEALGTGGPVTAPFNLRMPGAPGPFNGDATPYAPRTPGTTETFSPGTPETSGPLSSGASGPSGAGTPGPSGSETPGSPDRGPGPLGSDASGATGRGTGPLGPETPGATGPLDRGTPGSPGSEPTAPTPPGPYERTSALPAPPLFSAPPMPGAPSLPDDPTSREPAPGTGTRRDIPLASPSQAPTGPTERSDLRAGVLVPRSVVALTGTLLIAMAVTIGILLTSVLSGSGESDAVADSAEGAGAKGRFAAAPRACGLLDDKQAEEVVPGFKSSEVEAAECNWLNSHDWRKPNVEKFDLRVRLVAQKQDGSELARAKEYLAGKKKDFVDKAQFTTPKPAPPKDLKGIGEEAFSFGGYNSINLYGGSYKVTVVLRVSNLIAEVEYERGGIKTDSDGKITKNAEKVARWIAESLKTHG
ncbi:hypothetical protein SAMN05216276_103853 [Streptosporangium subroseum]|uniref:Protein kinase domain-containing protein n=1 Tax=Streptosporangium subroseum TaxID=106412 RepID=A0A239M8H5_9ACTN|nr:hypothetical protein [Streptosporangium subroseum]SNT38433.1 hypothetical protein SAMN05216276_103853 [Streptosporangium subroseum]